MNNFLRDATNKPFLFILSTESNSVIFFKTIYTVYNKGRSPIYKLFMDRTNPNLHRRIQHLSSQSNMHFPKENRPPVNKKKKRLCNYYLHDTPKKKTARKVCITTICGGEITWKKSARKVTYRRGR